IPRMTSKYFRTSIYLLPSLSEALERAIGRWQGAATEGAAAGRIISTVAGRTRRGWADAVGRRVRLVPPRIRGSVLVRDCGSGRISCARGKAKNADKSRTSHRTHPRDTHLRSRELDDYFCADHHVAGDAVYAGTSAMDFGAALGGGDRYQLAVFCVRSFPRTVA